MSFQTAAYALFLAAAWAVAVALPRAALRQLGLLAASYVFYASFGWRFVAVLLASSLFNFAWGKLLRRAPRGSLVWAGVLANLGVLAGFKYVPGVLAPVGISFFTFQAVSYLIDVWRGRDAEPTLLEFLLYMAFWPTVVSGPICRAFDLVPQFRQRARPTFEDVSIGCHRIVAGLFMKAVLADTLSRGFRAGEGIDFGFDRATGLGGLDVALLAVGFGLQLFFDFAGYSNVAIGSARLLGFRLPENFDRPFRSRTISAFWTRWHMSLSFWIRDYVFMPLATMRPGLVWRNAALVVSMTLFGVWHGAALRFAAWGFLQGLYLVAHRVFERLAKPAARARKAPGGAKAALSWALTFGAITAGWILFRAETLGRAGELYRALATPSSFAAFALPRNFYAMMALTLAGILVFEASRRLIESARRSPIVDRAVWLASPLYHVLQVVAIVAWSGKTTAFVYSRF